MAIISKQKNPSYIFPPPLNSVPEGSDSRYRGGIFKSLKWVDILSIYAIMSGNS
jgi:hypothetical protein